ncbi:AT-hook motif nuclear-localized protein 2 [Bienertia sinuspersici]
MPLILGKLSFGGIEVFVLNFESNICMEAKDSMTTGVTVIGAEAPSNYQMAPRSEPPSQVPPQDAISPTVAVTALGASMPGLMEKKKRGRPRKYGPDGSVSRSYTPMPTSGSAASSVGSKSSGKRGRGRAVSAEAKQQPRFEMVSMGDGFGRTDGANFTPHVITVNVGENIRHLSLMLQQKSYPSVNKDRVQFAFFQRMEWCQMLHYVNLILLVVH